MSHSNDKTCVCAFLRFSSWQMGKKTTKGWQKDEGNLAWLLSQWALLPVVATVTIPLLSRGGTSELERGSVLPLLYRTGALLQQRPLPSFWSGRSHWTFQGGGGGCISPLWSLWLLMPYYWMLTMNLPFLPACLPACLSNSKRRSGSSISCQSALTTTNHYIPSDFALTAKNPWDFVSRCVYMHAAAQLQTERITCISPSLYLFIYSVLALA